MLTLKPHQINTMRSEHNGHHSVDDLLKNISLEEFIWNSNFIELSLNFTIPIGLNSLVQNQIR